jgi:hypothetical protein
VARLGVSFAPGQYIRNADLQSLRVVSANLDGTPQLVHNLEVAGAHTYFVGELEAWGHNRLRYPTKPGAGGKPQPYDPTTGRYKSPCDQPSINNNPVTDFLAGAAFGYSDGTGGKPFSPKPGARASTVGSICGFGVGLGDRFKGLFD